MSKFENEKEIFHRFLKSRGLRCTNQRDLILEIFMGSRGHVTPEELYQKVKGKSKSIGFSTVYRTLNLLTDCNLARKLETSKGSALFERAYNQPHHDHLVCNVCGKYIEFYNKDIEKIQKQVAKEKDFKMTGHRMVIYGVCSDCR